MKFVYELGQTPLDQNEGGGLIPEISLQSELNELEAANIVAARNWLDTTRNIDPLTTSFLRTLHKRMLDGVWKWAGEYRKSPRNIGVAPEAIPTRMEDLVRDVAAQIQHKAYDPDEIAARYHHRLTFIHPFPNGNGRHARLAADLLLQVTLRGAPFTWGAGSGLPAKEVRKKYVEALQKADAGDYGPLKAFVRS